MFVRKAVWLHVSCNAIHPLGDNSITWGETRVESKRREVVINSRWFVACVQTSPPPSGKNRESRRFTDVPFPDFFLREEGTSVHRLVGLFLFKPDLEKKNTFACSKQIKLGKVKIYVMNSFSGKKIRKKKRCIHSQSAKS